MTPRLPAPSKEPEINDKKLIQDDDDAKHRKGIQWPGMHIFDAATPDGKRMRNQRKDARVLKEMLLDSLSVEPAEISYNRNGEFRASRDIYGPLSTESSPVSVKTRREFWKHQLILGRSKQSVQAQESASLVPRPLPWMILAPMPLVNNKADKIASKSKMPLVIIACSHPCINNETIHLGALETTTILVLCQLLRRMKTLG